MDDEQRRTLMTESEIAWAKATDKEKGSMPSNADDYSYNRQKMRGINYLKPNGEKGVLATLDKLQPGQKVLIWGGENTDRVYPMICDEKGVLRMPITDAVNMDDMCDFIEDASNPKPVELGFFQKTCLIRSSRIPN